MEPLWQPSSCYVIRCKLGEAIGIGRAASAALGGVDAGHEDGQSPDSMIETIPKDTEGAPHST